MCVAAVHTVMACGEDPELRAAVLGADFTVPDGQPLVWAMNLLGHDLPERVYGPTLMERACERAARTGRALLPLRRTRQGALDGWPRNLRARLPGLRLVGGYAPPFRELSDEEEDAVVADINASGADVVWVGIGVPKQEKWMARMRERLDAPVLIGVGAAFDFHAGLVPQAPDAMQRRGSSGCSASRRSRGGCGGATCATTRASWPASPPSTRGISRASVSGVASSRRAAARPRRDDLRCGVEARRRRSPRRRLARAATRGASGAHLLFQYRPYVLGAAPVRPRGSVTEVHPRRRGRGSTSQDEVVPRAHLTVWAASMTTCRRPERREGSSGIVLRVDPAEPRGAGSPRR